MSSIALKLGEKELVLDSKKIGNAVSDSIHSVVDTVEGVFTPSQPYEIDEFADLSIKPFDSKEVKFLKAQAAHWKMEASNWRGVASRLGANEVVSL